MFFQFFRFELKKLVSGSFFVEAQERGHIFSNRQFIRAKGHFVHRLWQRPGRKRRQKFPLMATAPVIEQRQRIDASTFDQPLWVCPLDLFPRFPPRGRNFCLL